MNTMNQAQGGGEAEIASLVEHEVRKRLTWRMIIIAISPLPLMLLLICFLYYYIQLQCLPVDDLLVQYVDVERRLRVLEQKLNVDNHSKVTNNHNMASCGMDK